MRKARFTENQIVTVIKSVEAGRTVKDICRGAGISDTHLLDLWTTSVCHERCNSDPHPTPEIRSRG